MLAALFGSCMSGIWWGRTQMQPPREVPPKPLVSALVVQEDFDEAFAIRKGGDIVLRGRVIGHDAKVAQDIWGVADFHPEPTDSGSVTAYSFGVHFFAPEQEAEWRRTVFDPPKPVHLTLEKLPRR